MTPKLITPPADPLVSLADMKAHLRIASSDDDAQIVAIEKASVAYLDGFYGVLGRCLMPQTWRQDFDGWCDLRIAMPDASDFVVTYEDDSGDFVAFSDFVVKTDERGQYIVAENQPSTDVVRVQYACAMPPEQLPAMQMAVKLYAEFLYDGSEVSPAFDALISAVRWGRT